MPLKSIEFLSFSIGNICVIIKRIIGCAKKDNQKYNFDSVICSAAITYVTFTKLLSTKHMTTIATMYTFANIEMTKHIFLSISKNFSFMESVRRSIISSSEYQKNPCITMSSNTLMMTINISYSIYVRILFCQKISDVF